MCLTKGVSYCLPLACEKVFLMGDPSMEVGDTRRTELPPYKKEALLPE
jgi:hypothetical protein